MNGRTGVINGLGHALGMSRFSLGNIALIAIVVAVVVPLNTTSALIEAARLHIHLKTWEPLVWEGSSVAVVLGLWPFVGLAMARWPLQRGPYATPVAAHLLLTIPFSLVHVAGMVALRKLAYGMVGNSYDFATPNLAMALLYEWRKDAVTYALIAANYWVLRRPRPIGEPAPEGAADESAPVAADGFEVRDGATRIFIKPREILWVEAAGNYLQLHTTHKTHFVRGVLTAWASRLAPSGFARIHRSRLVNCARIRELSATETKDFVVTLDDGRSLRGSRRFRATLDDALHHRRR
jgi:hypothetical protein